MALASNAQLYRYLVDLVGRLEDRDQKLADNVRSAAAQSAGLSTEFLGEARLALRRVDQSQILPDEQRAELQSILKQLDADLDTC